MAHIVMVTSSFPDKSYQACGDAAGSFAADLASALARTVKVTVVAPSGETAVEKMGGYTVRRFPAPCLPLSQLKPSNPGHWGPIWRTMRAGQAALDGVIAAEPVDHVFALWVLPSGYWARRAFKRRGIPYSTWALGSDIWALAKNPLARRLLKAVLKDGRASFADGFVLKDDVEAISGRKCEFLSSARMLPVPADKVPASEPPYKVAFLGRWHPNKGADLLMDALTRLSPDQWGKIREVRVFGGGPLEDIVHVGCLSLSAHGRPVERGGYLAKAEAVEFLRRADYVIIPSRIESIPVIFSDAMQMRCPVISTPVGDLPRLIEEFGVGILAKSASAEGIAEAIGRALDTPPASFADGLERIREQFDVDRSARRLLGRIGLCAS